MWVLPGWLILITLIVVLILLLVWTWMRTPEIEDMVEKYETPAEVDYESVFGYEDTPESRQALGVALAREEHPEPPAQNAFIIGDLLEFNYDNHAVALMYYQDAVNRIMDEPEDYHADHILDRVEDVVREIDVRSARDVVRNSRAKLKNTKKNTPIVDVKPDPQNVHDSHVNNDLRKIYHEIVQHNMLDNTPAATREELIEYLKDNLPKDKSDRARTTLRTMMKAGVNSAIGTHENMVIDEVWKRINSRENEAQRNELRESLADALVDSTNESNYTVCSGGRCARILSSLTLLDSDNTISTPVKTREILRSEIMSKAHKILEKAIETEPGGADYVAGEDTGEVNKFEDSVKKQITEAIVADYPDEDTKNLADLISDAHAGI